MSSANILIHGNSLPDPLCQPALANKNVSRAHTMHIPFVIKKLVSGLISSRAGRLAVRPARVSVYPFCCYVCCLGSSAGPLFPRLCVYVFTSAGVLGIHPASQTILLGHATQIYFIFSTHCEYFLWLWLGLSPQTPHCVDYHFVVYCFSL